MDLEQRANIKFCVKLGKSFTETYRLLHKVYADECMCRSQVNTWYRRFKDGRNDINNDPKSGRPTTASTDELIGKIREKMSANPTITLRMMADEFNVSKATIHQITVKLKAEKDINTTTTASNEEANSNQFSDE